MKGPCGSKIKRGKRWESDRDNILWAMGIIIVVVTKLYYGIMIL